MYKIYKWYHVLGSIPGEASFFSHPSFFPPSFFSSLLFSLLLFLLLFMLAQSLQVVRTVSLINESKFAYFYTTFYWSVSLNHEYAVAIYCLL